MKVFSSIEQFSATLKGAAFAIGNFDGVHLGHQAVIAAANKAAKTLNAPAAAMSFEPPPSAFFHPQKKQYRLTSPDTKAKLISQLDVNFLLNLKFDQALANLPPQNFIDDILQDKLAAKYIVVGENFRFGKKRAGDVDFLQKNSSIEIEVCSAIKQEGAVVSSTNIRAALKTGAAQKAAQLLGRWFQISGQVLAGKKLGRELGYPTLNIALTHYTDIAYGVYVVRCFIKGAWFNGVANIGLRPTIGDLQEPLLEVHLFDAKGDFYNESANVFLLDFLRAEEKFDTLDQLKAQIAQDSAAAKASLPQLQKKPYLFNKIE